MNNPRVPVQTRSIETKTKLEAAAKKLFSEKGYHNTNAKEIAAEAGVSVGSFYSYYENKKALFMEILRRHGEQKIIEFIKNAPIDRRHTKESVHQIIKAILDANDLSPEFHREAMAMRYSDPDVEALYQEIHAQYRKHFIERLHHFQDFLRVKDIEAAATVVCSASEEVLHAIKTNSNKAKEDQLTEALSDMIFRCLFK